MIYLHFVTFKIFEKIIMYKIWKNRKKRRILISIAIATFSILTIIVTLYAQKIVERELSSYMSSSTDGQYHVDLGNVDVNIFSQTVSISDFKIIGTQIADESYYTIKAKELRVENINVRKLLRERKLSMHLLALNAPEVGIYSGKEKLENDTTQQMISTEELLLQLKPFFTSQLHEIQIDEFQLQQATIVHYEAANPTIVLNAIRKLDIRIKNFCINADIVAAHNLFESDDVILQMSDFKYLLSDKIHELKLSRFTYLLNNDSFYGENLSIAPKDTTEIGNPMYYIDLPYFGIKTNISGLTQVDSIIIDSLVVLDAQIRYRPVAQNSSFDVTQLDQLNLYELIKGDLKKFAVSHLQLEAKSLIIESADSTKNAQLFKGMQFRGDRFEIDSLSSTNASKFLYTDNFKFTVSSYSHLLQNNVQRIEANNVQLSTYENYLKADHINLIQVDTLSQSTNYSFSCDSILLSDISLPKLLHERILPLKQVVIYAPRTEVERLRENRKEKPAVNLQEQAYKLVNNYVKGMYAETILIKDGNVELFDKRQGHSGYIGTGFRFELRDFKLDSESIEQSNRIFNTEWFDILLTDYTMDMNDQIHQLDFDTLHISSQHKSLDIKNAHLHPQNIKDIEQYLKQNDKHKLYQIVLPEVHLVHVDLLAAFFHQKLVIDRFEILEPNIAIESFQQNRKKRNIQVELNLEELYALMHGHINHLQVNELIFNQAKLHYKSHTAKGTEIDFTNQFSLKLEHFLLNETESKKAHHLPAEAFQISIEKHTFQLPDGVHSIYADTVSYSSRDSSVQAKNVKLYANSKNENYKKVPWIYQITVPLIHMKGVNIETLSFDNKIDLLEVELNHAEIQLTENFKQKKLRKKSNDSTSPLNFKMPKGIDAIVLQRLILKDSKFMIDKKVANKRQLLLNTYANSYLNHIVIEKDSVGRASFNVNDYDFELNHFKQISPQGDQQITFGTLQVLSEVKTVQLKDFEIKNKDAQGSFNRFVYVPTITISDIDLRNVVNHKAFNCSQIIIQEPEIDFVNSKIKSGEEKQKASNPFYIALPISMRKFISYLQANSITLQQGKINIAGNLPLTQIEHLNFTLNEVYLDTLISNKPFASESFSLDTRDVKMQNDLYEIGIDNLALSSAKKCFIMQGLGIMPRYDLDSYQSHFIYQNDYFVVQLQELKLQEFDIQALLKTKNLRAQNLLLNGIGLYVYRDKRLPFNESNRPPMPQEAMKNLPITFNIDSIQFKDSNFTYGERLNITPEAYKINFNDAEGLIHPFSNIESTFANDSSMWVDLKTKFQGVGQIQAQIGLNMLSSSSSYTMNLQMSPFELSAISGITDKAALVAINSGKLNELWANFSADKYSSHGVLSLDYEDLNITALKYKNDKIKQRKFVSALANMVVPSQTKLSKEKQLYTISFERDESKSIFAYWWKSIFSGILDSFDLGEEKGEKKEA